MRFRFNFLTILFVSMLVSAAAAGQTVINGTAGPDTLYGSAGKDVINGLGGNDIINSADGNDVINGGEGDDLIDGYDDRDDLTGGPGVDTFYFGWFTYSPDAGGQRDLITDLEAVDKIDLSNLHVTMENVAVTPQSGQIDWRFVVTFTSGPNTYSMGVDVKGAQPVAANFIF